MFAEIEFRSEAPANGHGLTVATPSVSETARSLANLCLWPAKSMKFYSVAQHNVMLSRLVPAHLAMDALLLTPLNALRNGNATEVHPFIVEADRILQGLVERDLCPNPGPFMPSMNEIIFGPLPVKIEAVAPEEAFLMFMARHRLLAYKHHLLGSARVIRMEPGKSHRP